MPDTRRRFSAPEVAHYVPHRCPCGGRTRQLWNPAGKPGDTRQWWRPGRVLCLNPDRHF